MCAEVAHWTNPILFYVNLLLTKLLISLVQWSMMLWILNILIGNPIFHAQDKGGGNFTDIYLQQLPHIIIKDRCKLLII